FLFGLMFYVPELRDILAKDGISVGGLGVFVILSYATGHLLAALGNVIEKGYWWTKGGLPSDWIAGPKPALLSTAQIAKVQAKVSTRLGLVLRPLSEMRRGERFPVFREIYSDVEKHGKPGRGEAFNGTYGLNRGLCSASVALAAVIFARSPMQWPIGVALLLIGCVYLYRMHRFGVHYAREIYNQFLLLPDHRTD
ncbi:MAG: hypothetical protein JO249_24815, partial [Acidobacteria bacterium]|nr:hypothetical protein [Acidobacteriota bacterium]